MTRNTGIFSLHQLSTLFRFLTVHLKVQEGMEEDTEQQGVTHLNFDTMKMESTSDEEEEMEKIKVEPDVCNSKCVLNKDFEEVKVESIPPPLPGVNEEEFMNDYTDSKKLLLQDQLTSSSIKEFPDQRHEKVLSISSDNKTEENSTAYICKLCQKSYSINEYVGHALECSNLLESIEPKSCDVSDQSFLMNCFGAKYFKCNECGKCFTQKDYLKRHSILHSGTKPFKCNVCGQSFNRQGNLKRHINIHTGNKAFKCTECGKSFTQRTHLEEHVSIHTGNRPFECSECGISFIKKSHLKAHIIVHTDIKPFKCNFCAQSFNRHTNLKRHISSHTGYKAFSCNECGKSFIQRIQLERHIYIHTGDKPFKCNVCEKSFVRQTRLKRHIFNNHTGPKAFKCNECGKSFTNGSTLKEHSIIHSL